MVSVHGEERERKSSESRVEQINNQVELPIFGQQGDSRVGGVQNSTAASGKEGALI